MRILAKTTKFTSLNNTYLVLVVYSIEYRLEKICKSLYPFSYLLFAQRLNLIGVGIITEGVGAKKE